MENNNKQRSKTSKAYAFNPVKEDESGKMAKRMVWSSESIVMALRGIEQGRKLIANPFYENNTKLLKGDLVFHRTEDEINEWKKCAADIIYFANTYCKLMTPEGIRQIVLRDYQVRYLRHLQANRLSIMLSCRQAAKTTSSAIFMLWYVLFNTDKNALVVGNKRKTAVEILDKLKKIFVELPFFLRPGIYKWNESECVFDNGCRIMAEATTINSGISFTFHCILSDEFAHLPANILDKFYNNLFPTVAAARARFMITSTQNGRNLFYKLWMGAVNHENEYAPFQVTWDMVPEWNPDTHSWDKRDEEWHRKQIANLGGEEQFNAQFGVDFLSSTDTLISKSSLQKTAPYRKIFVRKDIPGVRGSDNFFWHPEFDPMDMRREHIILTGDISEGIGQDFTVFQICRIIRDGNLECVGFYRSSTASREAVAGSLADLISKWCDSNRVLVSFEKNTYGDLFLKYLSDEPAFDIGCLVKYKKDPNTRGFTYGIKITPGNKTPACQIFKEAYERGEIIDESAEFGLEIDNFNNDGTGHYRAAYGHDDMVMSLMQLVFVRETLQYRLLLQEAKDEIEAADDMRTPAQWMMQDAAYPNAYSGETIYDF